MRDNGLLSFESSSHFLYIQGFNLTLCLSGNTRYIFFPYENHYFKCLTLDSWQEKLCDVIDILIPDPLEEKLQSPIWAPEREVTMESAVTGALENAFWQMVGGQFFLYELLYKTLDKDPAPNIILIHLFSHLSSHFLEESHMFTSPLIFPKIWHEMQSAFFFSNCCSLL